MPDPPLNEATERRRAFVGVGSIVAVFALFEVIATAAGPYGHFIDELYYLACARRLDFGYVDHPPLSIAILRAVTTVLGTSTLAMRIPSIAALGATISVAAALARRLGGGAFAQIVAALATACAPLSMICAGFYSMNAWEALVWPLAALLLLDVEREGRPVDWLWLGLLVGLGIENKHTSGVFFAALLVGLVATPARARLASRWPWIAAALAGLIIAPNVVWQAAHGFPSAKFYEQAQALKNVPTPPLAGIANQLKIAGPGAAWLWPVGLSWLLVAERARRWRFLGVAFVVLFVLMIASRSSRPDRIAAVYPVLFAAGAVALEIWTRERRRWARAVGPTLLAAGGALVAPVALPILPFDTAARYANAMGMNPQIERGKRSTLPQPLADRTGWGELVADVAHVYQALPPERRGRARILCSSYGTAGALELFGPAHGLPAVVATHNSYWTWGPGTPAPETVIAVGVGREVRELLLDGDELALVHHCDHCMSWRDGMEIRVGKPRAPWGGAWGAVQHFE